jgi:SAM-dependent methyltransferase
VTGPERVPDFEAMYRRDNDPWRVATSWYERRKLEVLMASLPDEHYASAWEPGCGPGIVTCALAPRVDRLVASDASETAVALAQARCGRLPSVRVARSELPALPFDGTVDLVVAAELLYYVPDLPGALDALWSAGAPGAHLVFVHWAHHPEDAFRGGPEMHARISLDSIRRRATKKVTHVDEDFVLDVYEAPR